MRKRFSRPSTRIFNFRGGGNTIPDRLFVKMTYDDWLFAAMGAVGQGTTAWRGNSVFDPYLAAGGHQPRYFDVLAGLYDQYVVHASRISVFFQMYNDTDAAVNRPMVVGVMPLEGSATIVPTTGGVGSYSYATDITERQYCKWKIAKRYTPQVNGSTIRLRHFMTTRKLLGEKRLDSAYDVDVSTNPADAYSWIWQISWANVDQANYAPTDDFFIYVRLTYYVEFKTRAYAGSN